MRARGWRLPSVLATDRCMTASSWTAWHTHRQGVWRMVEYVKGGFIVVNLVADDFGTLVQVSE
jgi:hypothetical protein